jgi:hypothetical protein
MKGHTRLLLSWTHIRFATWKMRRKLAGCSCALKLGWAKNRHFVRLSFVGWFVHKAEKNKQTEQRGLVCQQRRMDIHISRWLGWLFPFHDFSISHSSKQEGESFQSDKALPNSVRLIVLRGSSAFATSRGSAAWIHQSFERYLGVQSQLFMRYVWSTFALHPLLLLQTKKLTLLSVPAQVFFQAGCPAGLSCAWVFPLQRKLLMLWFAHYLWVSGVYFNWLRNRDDFFVSCTLPKHGLHELAQTRLWVQVPNLWLNWNSQTKIDNCTNCGTLLQMTDAPKL